MTRLGVLVVVLGAACKPTGEGDGARLSAPPVTSVAVVSSVASSAPVLPSSVVAAPLVEREDIPLGKPCAFRVGSEKASELEPDREWEARKGQRFVTCHFRVGARIAPVDLEIETTPGSLGIEALTIRSADGSVRPVRFEGMLTVYNRVSWEIETTDIDFDGVTDFSLFMTYGTLGCMRYRYYVFVPDPGMPRRGRYVDAKAEELCNPVLDPRRRILEGFDVSTGDKALRWQGDKLVEVKP